MFVVESTGVVNGLGTETVSFVKPHETVFVRGGGGSVQKVPWNVPGFGKSMKNGTNGHFAGRTSASFARAAENGPVLVYGAGQLGQEQAGGLSSGTTALLVTVAGVFGLATGFALGYVARGKRV